MELIDPEENGWTASLCQVFGSLRKIRSIDEIVVWKVLSHL